MDRVRDVLLLVSLGCSPALGPSPSQGPAPSTQRTPPNAPRAAGVSPGMPPPSPAPAEPVPGPALALGYTFERVETTPVVSLALGNPPKVAFLAHGEVLMGGGAGELRRVSVPEMGTPDVSAQIFFGRDDQPRLMGHRTTGTTLEAYYRRYKEGRFQAEPGELGPLAGASGPLYGVLGHDDPEVVCRPALFCLVKRITGWRRAPAHAAPLRIVLGGGTAFALHPDRIERLEGESWLPLAPARAFEDPVAIFVDAGGAPWVVEGTRDGVTRLRDGRWETLETPVRAPKAIAGTAPDDVWLAGASGAAHFDGRHWLVVPGVAGPLSLVAVSPPNVWLAGEAGVFRGSPLPR